MFANTFLNADFAFHCDNWDNVWMLSWHDNYKQNQIEFVMWG